ncbi:MAG: hypothetical protein ACI9IL_000763 [Rickettsiales bacterium]|jgi:hypothetical protein
MLHYFKNKERYEVVKIDVDEVNNYYIAINIPKDFRQNIYSRRGESSVVDGFIYKPGYSRLGWKRVLFIAKDFKFNIKKDDLNYYFLQRDKHITKQIKAYKRSVNKKLLLNKFHTTTVNYEGPCKLNIRQICLPEQRIFSTMMVFKG